MPLINTTLTPDQAKARTVTELKAIVGSVYAHMKDAHARGSALVKQNPYGLTEADVTAALGPDAAELARLDGLLVTALNAAVPGTVA